MQSPSTRIWWLGPFVALFFALVCIQATAGAGQCSTPPTMPRVELPSEGDPDDIDDIGDPPAPGPIVELQVMEADESITEPPQSKAPHGGNTKGSNSILGEGSLLRLWGDLLLRIALR
jgi:hypothetical protein